MKMKKRIFFFTLCFLLVFSLSVKAGPFGSTLKPYEELRPGQFLKSQSMNNEYILILQNDGNLVLYRKNKYSGNQQVLWASWTQGKPVERAVLQNDGNFVVYGRGKNNENVAFWNSGTQGKGANILIMQNDGNLVIYAPYKSGQMVAVWNTGTHEK